MENATTVIARYLYDAVFGVRNLSDGRPEISYEDAEYSRYEFSQDAYFRANRHAAAICELLRLPTSTLG